MFLRMLLALCLVGLIWGCAATTKAPASAESPVSTNVTHGYALLFDLMGDEKNVSKLLIIKRERAELRELIQAIAQRCGRAHDQLESLARTDSTLNLKQNGLPGAEVETRETIGKAKAKELLTDGGKEFELRLLLAQHEALSYGRHLAQVIANAERQPERKQFLQRLAADLGGLHGRVTAMLLANYTIPAKK
jgi:hypothetical protein